MNALQHALSRRDMLAVALGGAAVGLFGMQELSRTASAQVKVPPPALDPSGSAASDVAVLAGGCFWGVQGVYQHVKGVSAAVSGYAGGDKADADYNLVARGRTRHAESVAVTFDPRLVSYGTLLHVFFSVVHDPTQLNRQGPDVGPHYRSTIFPTTAEQAATAEAYIAELNRRLVFGRRVVTTIERDRAFYPAEDYHQDFLVRNPGYPYIVVHDLPKLRDLARVFPQLWRDDPVLVMAAAK